MAVTKKIFSADCVAQKSNLIEMVQLTGLDAGKSTLDVMGVSQAVVSDVNHVCEVQLRWMNSFPGGQKLKELLAILKVMVEVKGHRVKVAMKMAPLSEADVKEDGYVTNSPPSTSIFVNPREHWWGAPTPLRPPWTPLGGGPAHPISVPSSR